MFGGIGPITGENAIYGQAVMNGAQIAVDEINAAGGVNGQSPSSSALRMTWPMARLPSTPTTT